MKTKKTENKLVPALRFPEFEEDGEWEEKRLEKLCFKISDGIHSTPKYDDSGEYYFVNGNNLVNGIIVTNDSTKKVSKEEFEKHKRELGGNTILLSINGTIGNLSEYNGEKVVLGKSACYINVNEDKVDKKFILYSLKTEGIRSYFYAELTGSTIKNLSLKTIKNTAIRTPSPKEQQKIADCLRSIDQLMGAHEARLERLKNHKKGLMQQLFPQEGEKVPRLRFPEFRGDGEWEEKALIQITDKEEKWSFIGGPFGSNLKASDYTSDGIRIIQLQNIGDGSFHDNYKIYTSIEKADELLSCNIYAGDIILSKMGDPVGRACLIPDHLKRCVMASDGIRLVVDETKNSKYFMYSLINSARIRTIIERKATGSTRKRIGLSELKNIKLIIPKSLAEQQKIADCLSSLDTLIAAEAQKIGALGKHKKGLMQQLFPEINR